jgi:signal transduction histidine kinase
MNIVNVEMSDDPEEARQLLDKAATIAAQYSPERVFDIETRKTLSYFNGGDIPKFLEGYKKYREGVSEGKSSVHGRSMDIYYEACMGNTDKAIEIAHEQLGEDSHEAVTKIYEMSGRWKEAYESQRAQMEASDSINNIILLNSMEGYRDELRLYEIERETAKMRTITMGIIIALLLMLVCALGYIMFSHRRHMKQLKRAYEHALESDKMKAAFIQNMSHEVRTPLNVIAGFAQVLANPELSSNAEQRKDMAQMMLKNTHLITNQIDAMLELSVNEASGLAPKEDTVRLNNLLKDIIRENEPGLTPGVSLALDSALGDDYCLKTNTGMIKRMMNALLDNAVKNTTKGRITVKASADEEELTLTVEDTGCGIPANEREHIFERFFKLDSFKTGLGLGLPLCRSIATRLGGSIQLDSEYHNGARFVVRLPL